MIMLFVTKQIMPKRVISYLLILTAIVFALSFSPVVAGEVKNVRFSGNSDQTRIVIELDAKQKYRRFTLASNGSRLVLDFPKLHWNIYGSTPIERGEGAGHGLVDKYRFAMNSPTTSRLVFELVGPIRVAREFYLSPTLENQNYRLVFDLESTDMISFIAGAGMYEPFSPVEVIIPVSTAVTNANPFKDQVFAPSLKPVTAGSKRVVVIDAGHGGKDPGAIGKRRKTKEKNVNLRVALALKKRLDKSGKFKVYLTRSADRFLELEDRVTFARKREADLFISMHADSAGNSKARGASVYTLSERARSRSRSEILKGSNWLIDVNLAESRPEVSDILIDLSQRQTKNQSAVFAELLIPKLAKVGPLIGNTHRNGNLFVLLAPDVPAVLVEAGFLSNKHDEMNLNSKRYINKLTNAVGDAVEEYFVEVARLQASN